MVKSPCLNICEIDKDSGLCNGCKRTIKEIANWSNLSDKKRGKILSDAMRREEKSY